MASNEEERNKHSHQLSLYPECKNVGRHKTILEEKILTRLELANELEQHFISDIAFPGCNVLQLKLGRFGPVLEIESVLENGILSMLITKRIRKVQQ